MTLDWDQHPEAEEELAVSAEWYERRERGLGYELLRAAEEAVESTLDPAVQWGFYRSRQSDPGSTHGASRAFPSM